MTQRTSRLLLAVGLVVLAVSGISASAAGAAGAPASLRALLLAPLDSGTHTITADAGLNGSIDPSGAVPVTDGDSQGFTITPDPHFHVADVLVDGSSVGAVTSYTFDNVTEDHTISASFAVDTYTITPSTGAHGSISPSAPQTVNWDDSQTFTITPATGYHVDDVLVDGSSVGAVASYTFNNVADDHTISATFAIDTYTITPSAGANGSISPSTVQTVNLNGSKTFTITPNAHYHVADVLVDGSSVGAVTSYTFDNVADDHTISATFAIDTYTITPSAGAHGSISPATAQPVNWNGSQTFTITPNANYHVADVLVDGSSVGAVTTYTFSNVAANHTISATFAIVTYTISASAGANGSISPDGDTSVDYGSDLLMTITPATGYHVADVLVDGSSVGAVTSYTFTSVTANHTISATFAIDTFTISASAGAHGSISPAGTTTVDYGSDFTLTITPATGYYVANVLVDGASAGASLSYKFTNVTADHTIAASFAPGKQTKLDFSTASSALTYGASATFTGQLLDYGDPLNPVGLGGYDVSVETAPSSTGPWVTQDTTTTDADPAHLGEFSLTLTPSAPTYYRLRFVAGSGSQYGSLVSQVQKLGMRPKLGRPAGPSSVRARRYFVVTGALEPRFVAGGNTVSVKVYRFRGGHWRPTKTVAAVNVDSGDASLYRLRIKLVKKGKYRFTASATPAGWNAAATSPSKTVKVK
ncbi:MAG TPA: hypothetical protein VMH50_01565 [Thermoleophilia bacterium]|nr:hypothetical protein [Thermoleophilia bacterium]